MLWFESRNGPGDIKADTDMSLTRRLKDSLPCFPCCFPKTNNKYPPNPSVCSTSNLHKCRTCYSLMLMVSAISVVLATISYQAFTWQINCENKALCLDGQGQPKYQPDANWASQIYLVLQILAFQLQIIGDFYRGWRKYVQHVTIYSVLVMVVWTAWVASVNHHQNYDLFGASIIVMAPMVILSLYVNYVIHKFNRMIVPNLITLVSALVVRGKHTFSDTSLWCKFTLYPDSQVYYIYNGSGINPV